MRKMAPLMISAVAAALLCRCGSLSMDPLAGGSGAGNPGNTVVGSAQVVLSMYAVGVDDQILGISLPMSKTSCVLDSTISITAPDKGGLLFRLTRVTLSNVVPRFLLDSALKPDSLLQNMAEPPAELTCDSNSILLRGLHEMDVVEGKIDSSKGALRLPVARYTGVGIGFQEYDSKEYHFLPPPDYSKITMRGTFIYKGETHGLTVDINYAPDPCRQQFWFGGGLFTLSSVGDTTRLELRLDAERWFSQVDFGSALDNGSLFFDPYGTLRISDGFYNPCVWGIQSTISSEFFASGKLVVY